MTDEGVDELIKVVKDVILENWMEELVADATSFRESIIKMVDAIIETSGDIKLSEFREIMYIQFDYIIQEMRDQMLAGLDEKGLLK